MVKQNTKNGAAVAQLREKLDLAKSENAKISALLSSIGEGVIVTDQYGKIERINKAGLEILGYKESDILNKWFVSAIRAVNEDGSVVDAIDRPVTRAFLAGASISERMYYLNKKDISIPVSVSVSPVMLDNAPYGAIEIFRDLSDELVKEKIQSEFISIVSHQLRTPLSSINTYAQMLNQGYAGKATNKQKEFISIIENSAKRMNELIHTMLNVTRVEAGNINVNILPVYVDILLEEAIDELTPQAKAKKIKITLISTKGLEVETDGVLLREVLSNLLSNAIRYTPANGGITVRVKVKDRIIFSVADNGYGIPLRSQKHVFTKFFRANNAVKNDVSGTGIGLYLVKQIADRLDGDIWFNSKVGQGSTFYFSLPLVGSSKKEGGFTLE
jgi:PAS domain S-box-containing protein